MSDLKRCKVCGAEPFECIEERCNYTYLCGAVVVRKYGFYCRRCNPAHINVHLFDTEWEAGLEWNRQQIINGLKPCPFCGRKPHLKNGRSGEDAGYYVSCECGARTEVIACCKAPEEEAAKIWNRRTENATD